MTPLEQERAPATTPGPSTKSATTTELRNHHTSSGLEVLNPEGDTAAVTSTKILVELAEGRLERAKAAVKRAKAEAERAHDESTDALYELMFADRLVLDAVEAAAREALKAAR